MTLVQNAPKKIYIRVDEQGWQPGANTLAYYHIEDDDNTTIHDRAGNNNLSYPSNAYITDASAGKVLNFAYTNYASGNVINMGTEYTEIAWVYWNGGSGNQTIFAQNSSSSKYPSTGIHIDNLKLVAISEGNYPTSISMPQGAWTMICWTRNSNGDMKLYLNGLYQTIKTNTPTPNYSGGEQFYLGLWRLTYYQVNGYFKTLILENKERTDTEISDYYNLTKADFGL